MSVISSPLALKIELEFIYWIFWQILRISHLFISTYKFPNTAKTSNHIAFPNIFSTFVLLFLNISIIFVFFWTENQAGVNLLNVLTDPKTDFYYVPISSNNVIQLNLYYGFWYIYQDKCHIYIWIMFFNSFYYIYCFLSVWTEKCMSICFKKCLAWFSHLPNLCYRFWCIYQNECHIYTH